MNNLYYNNFCDILIIIEKRKRKTTNYFMEYQALSFILTDNKKDAYFNT